MRVLIAGFDLFAAVGGGQTFYRGVITRHPQVQFYYLRHLEKADSPRPVNAHPIRYRPSYDPADLAEYFEPGPPSGAHHDFLLANNIARAAAGRNFDVVDTPDYERTGIFLRGALRRHGVSFRRLAVSMHGALSTSVKFNWWSDGQAPLGMMHLERLQYAGADIRYFISRDYQDFWAKNVPGVDSHFLDPLWFFSPPPRQPYSDSAAPPNLYFIGRTERLKGPHYFVQMLWWLPREIFGDAAVVGPDCKNVETGVRSTDLIRKMVKSRRLENTIRVLPSMNAHEMARVFASKTVVFTPSQYDTLNLLALESLLSGCPTVIGSGAGACRYLRERFPAIPFVEFDIHRFYASLPAVEELIVRYDEHRGALEAAVRAADLTPTGMQLSEIYSAPSTADATARAEGDEWDQRLAHGLRQRAAV